MADGVMTDAGAVAFVHVRDRARGRAFYRDLLGLRLVIEDEFGDQYALGGGTALRVTALPDYTPSGHPALGWQVGDIAAEVDALAAKGIVFEVYPGFGQDPRGVWTSPKGDVKLAWFKDPDGNLLSLTQSA